MCSLDYDSPLFYRQTYRNARKEHKCSECGRIIMPTEFYQYAIGKWDRALSVFKTCINCCVPQKWLLEKCGGYLHGGLYEEILEHAQEYRAMYLYRWAIGMRWKWRHYLPKAWS